MTGLIPVSAKTQFNELELPMNVNQIWKAKSEFKKLENAVKHIAGIAMFMLGLTFGPLGVPIFLLISPAFVLLMIPISIALIKLGLTKIDESEFSSKKLELTTPAGAHSLSAKLERTSLTNLQNLTLRSSYTTLNIQDLYEFGFINEIAFSKLLDLHKRSNEQAELIKFYEKDSEYSISSNLPLNINSVDFDSLPEHQKIYVNAKRSFISFENEWIKLRDNEIVPYLPRPEFSMNPRSALEQLPKFIENLAGF